MKKLDLKGGKNVKLSPSNVNLLLAVAGILVLLLGYFVGYKNLSEKNDAVASELDTRSAYLTELKAYYDNLAVYDKGKKEAMENLDKNLEKLPAGIKNEDYLLYMIKLHDDIGIEMNNVSFSDDEQITVFNTMINGKMTEVTGFRATSSSNAAMTYEQLKNYIDYVYNRSDSLTYVNSVTVNYDASAAKLNTSFNLSKYYIKYQDCEYKPVPAASVPLGRPNLFS